MTANVAKDSDSLYPKRAVVDTNVILNVALGEMDNLPAENLERSKGLLDDGIRGNLQLFLPSICLIELSSDHLIHCLGNPKGKDFRKMKSKVIEWCEDSTLPFADLTLPAAQWYHEKPRVQCIRPMDAAILATAKYCNSSVVYTWDKPFIKYAGKANETEPLGITVSEPPERPLVLLEDHYR